jgi:hypothetical protein
MLKQSHSLSLRNLVRYALVLVVLLLAATTLPGATAQERPTHTVGAVVITANTFVELGGGQWQAYGDIWLGEHLHRRGGHVH